VPAHLVGLGGHVHPQHSGLTRAGGQQSVQQADSSGLAGTVRPEKAEYLPHGHCKVEPVHGHQAVETAR